MLQNQILDWNNTEEDCASGLKEFQQNSNKKTENSNKNSDKVLETIMGICKESRIEIPDTVIDRTHSIGK